MTLKKSPTDLKDPGADVLKSILKASKESNGSEKLHLTREEKDRIEKALDKKEFRDLMVNYVDEISDPKHKAEQDEYIRQLESQNGVPEGKKIIRPLPGFVLQFKHLKSSDSSIQKKGHGKNISKSRDRSSNPKKKDKRSKKYKLIVNVVYSKEIKPPSCSTNKKDANGKGGQWTVPYFFGPLRMEPDNERNLLATFDCCFHPNALVYASKHIPFRDLIAQTAREGAATRFESINEHILIDSNYLILKGISYRNGSPSVLVISESSDLLSQPLLEVESDNSTTPCNNDNNDVTHDQAASKTIDETESSTTKATFGAGFKKGFLMGKACKASTKTENIRHMKKYDCHEIIPHYEVIEQGEFDMANHTNNPSLHEKSNRPKHLIYKISLVGISSTKNVDLDVSEKRLILKSTQTDQNKDLRNYHLNVNLPYPVMFTDGSAKFDKDKSTLIVTLPVCKPEHKSCFKQPMPRDIETSDPNEQKARKSVDDGDNDNFDYNFEDNSTFSISSDNSIVIVNNKKDLHSRWIDDTHIDDAGRSSFARDTKIPVQNSSPKDINDDQNSQNENESNGSADKKCCTPNLRKKVTGGDDDDFELVMLDPESSTESPDDMEDSDLERYFNNHSNFEDPSDNLRGDVLFALD